MSQQLAVVTTAEVERLSTTSPADEHPALVYLARLGSSKSRDTMRQALDSIATLATSGRCDHETMAWHALRYQHTAALRARLAELHAPATVNKYLAALRGVLREAWRLGQMPAEDYYRAADLASVRGETLPRGRALSAGELRTLFEACAADRSAARGARNAALLALLYGGGLRRSEAVALDLADYDAESGALTVRRGKGNKARLVYVTNGGRDAMSAWLALRGAHDGPLFSPVNKAGRIETSRRLTDQAVYGILRSLSGAAKVATFSPHDLRRTFISDLLDAGADIATVQRLAGHANVETTSRYDRRGEQTKVRAAELLHVPYEKPRASGARAA